MMCPFPGNQHLELHDGQAPLPAQLLGEDHQLTADALAPTGGVGDQHAELASAGVELLDAHGPHELAVHPGHGDLPDNSL